MIKRKGVCDRCGTEFELDEGSFAVRIEEDCERASKKWTITVLSCSEDTPEEGFTDVCGITCLYEVILGKLETKRTKECKFRIIDYEGTDDTNAKVVELTDKRDK